jgi:hypothetical protein
MATVLKHKRSAVASSTPATSDLEFGELALNTRDGKVFFKTNDGSSDAVVTIESSASAAIIASQLATTAVFAGDGTTTQYAIGSTPDTVNNVWCNLDGLEQTPGVDFTVLNSTLTFTTAPASGDAILIRNYKSVGSSTSVQTNKKYHFIPTATSITVLTGADNNGNVLRAHPSSSMVFLNGAKLIHDDDYLISGDGLTITLVAAVSSPDEIEIHSFGTASLVVIENVEEVGMLHSVQKSSRIVTAATTLVVIDQVDITLFQSCKYQIMAKDSVTGNFQILEINSIHDGTDVYLTEYGEVLTSSSAIGTFSVDITSGMLRLTVVPASTNSSTFTAHRIGIEV